MARQAAGVTVEVTNLTQYKQALRKQGVDGAAKLVRDANKRVALALLPLVTSAARGLSAAAAKVLAPSIKAKGDRDGAFIIEGTGSKKPGHIHAAAIGWELGSKFKKQFPLPWVGNQYSSTLLPGHALGRTVESNVDLILDAHEREMENLWAEVARRTNR